MKSSSPRIRSPRSATRGSPRSSTGRPRRSSITKARISDCAAAPRISSCSRACSRRTAISISRPRRAIFETFRKLHPILKEQHFLNPKEEEDDPYESTQVTALVANEHGIFGVYSMREVFEYSRYWAVGSGREFALGAMYAEYPQLRTAAAIARVGIAAGATLRPEFRPADDALHGSAQTPK